MSRGNWAPIMEASERTDGAITVGHLGLPQGIDLERIELNLGALRRGVLGWGNYNALTLNAYVGDEDTYSYGASMDESGEGYATGAVSVSKAERSQYNAASDATFNSVDSPNGSLGIRWNSTVLAQRIETHEQYDPTIRARQIDKEIRRAAIKGVWKHNTSDVVSDRYMISNMIFGALDAFFVKDITAGILQSDYSSVAYDTASRGVLMLVAMRCVRGIMSSPYGYGFSDFKTDPLFLTMRPTRAAIGAGILATSHLVRAS